MPESFELISGVDEYGLDPHIELYFTVAKEEFDSMLGEDWDTEQRVDAEDYTYSVKYLVGRPVYIYEHIKSPFTYLRYYIGKDKVYCVFVGDRADML